MGASNKNAQDNIQPKGNKKPLQVLHISKKDNQKIDEEQTNTQEEIKKEDIEIKPQIIKNDSVKKIQDNNIDIMNGNWSQEKGSELYGKNIGLLGFGNIGQKLVSLLQPFNCKISFFDEKKFGFLR
mgnify:CR=1 FL=1